MPREPLVLMLYQQTEILEAKVKAVLSIFDLQAQRARLAELEHEAGNSNLWNDPQSAQNVLVQLNSLRSEVDEIMGFQSKVEEAQFAIEFVESDESMGMSEVSSIISDSLSILSQLEIALERWEVKKLLSGTYDECGARLSITAGAGGVDAMDWVAMLERMYLRWSEQSGYVTQMVERQVGDEAGLKGVEMEVEGRYAYGFLKGEKGTHRLVRNSPFNSKGLRQTSFAGVEVMPILTESQALPVAAKLQIPEKDLEISFMRAGGKGGQNVNKVETGVRIVHVPTGLAVKCTQERSQLQNRAIAMDQLRAKLLVVLEEQQAMQVAEIRGDVVKAEWGQQIRNYVLHPYKLVKDTRTGEETADVQSVLDGAAPLSNFITAHLRLKASGLSATLLHEKEL
ncbi:hypothetical protein CEUSTIGMA_g797.t1 [Chlamydomonas eustigma]|uniref:Prokaryotic-type class I peptide chain release factors domain-containing protein n=1 Tax=Chlamydomonas eustigma TaxID=1157962 RepID=A0A250WR57_9CHLO|nr:hypothetical protein CEUSTIGMA_g797.t1 [Chlamydomonas eustigma]|eukprot:GAX73344.1 hypothetical protein CEUSTIGMA_g797.t1 [Chlamydomonas eustigma]